MLRRDLILNRLIASPLVPIAHRWRLLRAYGLQVEPCRVSPDVWIGSERVTIGRGAFINYGCMLNTSAPISIGAGASLGMRVTLVTSSHEIGSPARRAGAPTTAPIVIGDGAWIGAGATILPGVTVGAGAVVAAGAVVTKDVPADTVVAGVPARPVRSLDPVA